MLERFLDDLENRIDPAVEARLHGEWTQFARGEFRGDLFSPRRVASTAPSVPWPSTSVNRAIESFEQMALQQFATCSAALARGSGALLCVRCNYGTGILPSLFGAELFVMPEETDTLPTVKPLADGKDAVRALLDRGVPDLRAGLGGRTFEMAGFFLECLRSRPRVGQWVTLYHPDLQGPMDICELLWGSSLFLDVLDEPALVHQLLELVADTYIAFMQEWRKIVPRRGDCAVHWSLMHRGGIMLRDDSAMNFSPAMYDEFIRPYDARLLAALGGGGIHFCGRGDHYIASAAGIPETYAVNLSQPEHNDMERIFRYTVDRDVQVVGLSRPAAEAALARGRSLHGNVHCW
ncbi:MAG: hypothetical protein GXP31_06160 [Kiritimatiellaeota bacterium]|nr:hypothetical protein [Kiritimatiellota bacterium]